MVDDRAIPTVLGGVTGVFSNQGWRDSPVTRWLGCCREWPLSVTAEVFDHASASAPLLD
jgi:hypothetical protein